MLGRCITVLAE
jgi:kinesin family protein 13